MSRSAFAVRRLLYPVITLGMLSAAPADAQAPRSASPDSAAHPLLRSSADSLHPLLRSPSGLVPLAGVPVIPGNRAQERLGAGPVPERARLLIPPVPAVRLDTGPARRTDSLGVALNARLETRTERLRTERCLSQQITLYAATCRSPLQPNMDFQFDLRSGGSIGDRIYIDVDYDSQREFDASNVLSLRYVGAPGDMLQRVEVGNVSFATPPSRFITAGIPTGNYGIQASGAIGRFEFQSIVARQTGNVVRDRVFTVGERAMQRVERELEDHQIEPRRFFFLVDPRRLPGYPNIDILDAAQLRAIAATLPDSIRPSRVRLYRLVLGGQPPAPGGPRFRLIGSPTGTGGEVYEPLREQLDYYVDPSGLWVALARPLSQGRERLVAAWTVRLAGRDTVLPASGGTPDLEFSGREQLAHLLWDPRVEPGDDAFYREIRSVYRVGGDDVRRETLVARVVTGPSADLERPKTGPFATYLQMFGIADPLNPAHLNVEQRIWPRTGDPIVTASGDPSVAGRIVRDLFLVFPSLTPFAARGLVVPGNPTSDSLYSTPGDYLYSSRHPPSAYRIRIGYQADASAAGAGTLALGSIQVRPGSERLTMDGVPLVRGVDYGVDYDLGTVTFTRPDTLFLVRRRIVARFEENPLFVTTPTSVAGLTSRFVLPNGHLGFTALTQAQQSAFTRPTLGYEPARAVVGGIHGDFTWDLPGFQRTLARLPGSQGGPAPARLRLQGELAASVPWLSAGQQAYLESFEGEGGFAIPLGESAWYLSSRPAESAQLLSRVGTPLSLGGATTLAWQNTGLGADGRAVTYALEQIDPRSVVVGTGFSAEQMLWLTLYPLQIAEAGGRRWMVDSPGAHRRWRSLRVPLGAGGGADLSRVEQVEFWTAIDTAAARRTRNPLLVIDIGDISENTVAFAPDTLQVTGPDSLWRGKRIVGLDTLDTERNPITRSFNAEVGDNGLPGDVAPRVTVLQGGGIGEQLLNVPVCRRSASVPYLGRTGVNCTVGNDRLDEEDLDADGVLNLTDAQRDRERIARFIVDLADPSIVARTGRCGVGFGGAPESTVGAGLGGARDSSTRCWVMIRLPFAAPTELLNAPNLRRARAMRVTMVAGPGLPDEQFSLVPIARLRLTGAPWLRRNDRPLTGIGGEQTSNGFVIATVVGTADRDSLGLDYQPPPGVADAPDTRRTGFETGRTVINERSLRLLAGGLEPYDRAEAFYRFPEGRRNFMTYRELRLWARGRGHGWGTAGELNFYVKLGRDAGNFYLYRTPVEAGRGAAAWLPEIRVDFGRFHALRARLENAMLGREPLVGCTGIDSVLVARASASAPAARVYAACDRGYIVYSVDPFAAAPNLAAVQELAVGMLRVRSGPPIPASDTLELWVNDIRLAGAVADPGYAGTLGATFSAGELGDVRMHLLRRDPRFRQLTEPPTFLDDAAIDVTSNLRLDRLLPSGTRLQIPVTVAHLRSATAPLFVSNSDLRGTSIAGLRAPRSSSTSVVVSIRRTAPSADSTPSFWSALLDQLGATASWDRQAQRSEYQSGAADRLTVGLEYLRERAGDKLLPSMRLYSAVVRADDDRTSYLLPADAPPGGLPVQAEERLWRNGAAIEFRPLPYAVLRWNGSTVRDMRRFVPATTLTSVAAAERDHIVGTSIGVERERLLQGTASMTPQVRPWLRLTLEGSSAYGVVRDPSASFLVTADSSQPVVLTDDDVLPTPLTQLRLPRRLTGSRQGIAGITITPARVVSPGPAMWARTLLRRVQPFSISLTRAQLTGFDHAATAAPLLVQLGLAGGAFRHLGGRDAASASDATTLAAASGLLLPRGVTLDVRGNVLDGHGWTARMASRPGETITRQWTVPDAALRWTLPTPAGLMAAASASARVLHTRQAVTYQRDEGCPEEITACAADPRVTRLWRYPLQASVTWNLAGALTSSAGFTHSRRVDSLPGSVLTSHGSELQLDLARVFPAPRALGLRGDIRSRLSWQESRGESRIGILRSTTAETPLTDNGRRAISINADTEVAEHMTFTLQGSQILSYDHTINRRVAQTVISAVLQIGFFAGDLR